MSRIVLLVAMLQGSNVAISQDVRTPLTALFAADDVVLADNFVKTIHDIHDLPPDLRFSILRDWVLPSQSHSKLRVQGKFVPTNPPDGSWGRFNSAVHENVLSPVFALLQAAEESGQLDVLFQQIEQLPSATDPDDVRSQLALQLMIHALRKETEQTSAALVRLTSLVRTRDAHVGYKWWPESLVLAFGMTHFADDPEFLDLVTGLYEPQIVRSKWSDDRALDSFVAGCFARVILPRDEKDDMTGPDFFQDWIPASVSSAFSRGTGVPSAKWECRGNEVHKVMGHDNDYLYFPTPLVGDFEVVAQVSGFNYRETQLAYGGVFASHHWTRNQYELGRIRNQELIPIDPPIASPADRVFSRIAVRDDTCLHTINGRQLYEQQHQTLDFPWLALRTYRLSRGQIGSLSISGQPVVPPSISLLESRELTGWFSYYEEPVAEPNRPDSWRLTMETNQPNELIHERDPELAGTHSESLLLYHRPLREDGTIEYEFYYDPDRAIVHPAIDRRAFLLTMEGMFTHRITDGRYEQSAISPDNATREFMTRPLKDILTPESWNRMKIQITGNRVSFALNNTPVLEQAIEGIRHQQFGLFHFQDQSSVRVRNLHWAGQWSMLPDSPTFPPSNMTTVVDIEKDVARLPHSFSHSFQESELSNQTFRRKGGALKETPIGLMAQAGGKKDAEKTEFSWMGEIGGDFDLRVSYRDFQRPSKGRAGVDLGVTLNQSGHQVRLERSQWSQGEQYLKAQIGWTRQEGQMDYSDDWHVWDSSEGTLRIVRVGDVCHMMIAEADSSRFHLLRSERVGTDDLRLGETTLCLHADKDTTAKVVWTALQIRAERLELPVSLDSSKIVSKLNEERQKLPHSKTIDLTKSPQLGELFYRSSATPWESDDDGLKMESKGAEGWVADILTTRFALRGDFDATLRFNSVKLAEPESARYSAIIWQSRLPDDKNRSTLSAMLLRTPEGLSVQTQRHQVLKDGRDSYTWHGNIPAIDVRSLRLARRGATYTTLMREAGFENDQVIHQTSHASGPIHLQCLLHTGAIDAISQVRLLSMEIHSDSEL